MTAPSCAEVEARLVDALDGRLDAASSMRFHAHLETCAGCRDRAALWRALTPRLREAEPAPPDAMAIRRMQLEVERRLTEPARLERPARISAALAARARRARRIALVSMVGVTAAATLLALWLRPRWAGRDGAAAYAGLTRGQGLITLAGRSVGGAEAPRIAVGAPLVLGAGAEADLALDRGATVRVTGPARLTFQGTAADVALRLDDGRVQVQVAHRRADETFAVVTRDLGVTVRGTRFAVTATPQGSRVEVTEGRVAVRFPDGRNVLVPAGESVDSASPPGENTTAPDVATTAAPPVEEAPPPSRALAALSCAAPVHACRIAAQGARDSMRQGDAARALRLVGDGDREAREVDPRCGAVLGACRDELGYLRAEALNQAGRARDAVTAFHALDRRGAPAAMRQNALYAAAQIERQHGRTARARADYERALEAAPRGALGEEALAGAMESARAAAEGERARALAARYLRSFPKGMAAGSARRLLGGGSEP